MQALFLALYEAKLHFLYVTAAIQMKILRNRREYGYLAYKNGRGVFS